MAAPLQLPRVKNARQAVRRPTLGVYLDRPAVDIDQRAMQNCLNVRIQDKRIVNTAMGRENFPMFAANPINLDNEQVLMIEQYRSRAGVTTLILANQNDLFRYNPGSETITYMTPQYTTGTASASGLDNEVDGVGTAWNTQKTTLPIAGGYGKNVRAGDMIHFGTAGEDDPTLTWYEIASVTDDLTLVLTENPGAHGSGPYTIRQRLQGDNNDIFESDIFQDSQDSSPVGLDVMYVTNGVEALSWDGDDATFTWFWPDFTFKKLITHKQTLACWNLVDNGVYKPGAVRYSELNHPDNMATNGAGEFVPADGVLELLDVRPIGDQLACYYQGDIVIAQYVGPPIYFIARVAIPGVGLVAQRAIMDFGDYHEFLSRDGVYRFDGVTIDEQMDQVFRDVLRRVAPNRIKRAYAYLNDEFAEVYWSIPLSTDGQAVDNAPRTAYVEHYLEDNGPNLPTPVTIRDWPYTAVGFFEAQSSLQFQDFPATAFEESALTWDDRALQQAFPFMIAGDEYGDVHILNTSNTNNGTGYVSFAHFPRFALGDGETKGHMKHVEPYTVRRLGADDYQVVVFVQMYDRPDGGRTGLYGGIHDLRHLDVRYVPIRRIGRYADVRFYTNGYLADQPAQPWELAGYEVKAAPAGER